MPKAVTLGEVPRLKQWHDVEVWPEAASVPGVLVFEFRGPLVFASAEWFEEEVERKRLQAEVKVKFIILLHLCDKKVRFDFDMII